MNNTLRTAPRVGDEHSEFILTHVELRDGIMFWKPRDDRSWNTKWAGKPVGFTDAPCGYKRIRIRRRWYLAHRVIWFLHYGRWPQLIDHINRNRSDNRLENLREVSASQNQWNTGRHANNSSGHPGVRLVEKRWVATIRANRKAVFLGSFVALEDAVAARKRAEELRKQGVSA